MIRSENPHDPSDIVLETEEASSESVERAVGAGTEALGMWSKRPAQERGDVLASIASALNDRSEEVAGLVQREVGKPISEARGEVRRAVSILDYYARMILAPDGETYPALEAEALLFARRFPVGVCALLTPWNFPLAIPVWKLAPAIGYGNTVVFKPAPEATASGLLLSEIANTHLPQGVLNVVVGDAATGDALIQDRRVAAVSFTGSTQVGNIVAQKVTARGARIQCEMGGQNPSVVLEDADLDRAAAIIAYAAMGYAGQKCTATSRVIVQDGIYVDFRGRLVAAVEALEVSDPRRDACVVGPLISERARKGALDAIRRSGGRVLTGGQALGTAGYYLAPTLVELEQDEGVLAKDEVFAPVSALLRVKTADEAIDVANSVDQGLVAALFTRDLAKGIALVQRLDAGLVRTNAATTGVDFHAPFGGSKASSFGPKEQGLAARDFYTQTRTILVTP